MTNSNDQFVADALTTPSFALLAVATFGVFVRLLALAIANVIGYATIANAAASGLDICLGNFLPLR